MSWLKTASGLRFDPLAPDARAVNIDDIAHALGNLCRFAGHTRNFYSVAQHSVLVSRILEDQGHSPEVQIQGLLHDATEAYMVDVPRPIKVQPFMGGYREAEERLEKVLASAFGFETLTPPEVKAADLVALATEARDLMGNPRDWPILCGVEPVRERIVALGPIGSRWAFINRYQELLQRGAA